ncbi:MAG: zinc ribbon domain-containing protein [Clostridiales bacterium]|nr:zinc ribbon domain-containing protein [Clostridiales bacterium]
MPFYDLKCEKCGNEFNVKASLKEREDKQIACPDCGGNELSRVYSGMNIFQGRSSQKTSRAECPNIGKCGGCCGE